jgi:hypothetical protein
MYLHLWFVDNMYYVWYECGLFVVFCAQLLFVLCWLKIGGILTNLWIEN